jgi:hypothetical protein
MKKITMLIAATLAGVALSANVYAASCDQCGSSCATKVASLPVPQSVVHPTGLPRQYENVTVQMALTVDESGVPHHVTTVGQVPKDLAARLIPVVSQWRFTPAHSADGKAIAATVVLPLELVDGYDAAAKPMFAAVASAKR